MARGFAAALIAAGLTLTAPPAAAQSGLPSHDESVALLNIIALRGGECGLLKPWEAATVQALADQGSLGWEPSRLEAMERQKQARLAQTACDTPFLNVWIDGARPGLEGEYLSLHLVVYRTLLSFPEATSSASRAVHRTTPDADIAVIDAQLARLEAAGAVPDGGGPWPEFIARTSAAVERYVPMLDRGEAPADVAFLIPRAIAISELWLAEQAADEAAP